MQAIKDSHVLVADSSDCKTIMLIRIVLHGTHKLFLVQLIIQKKWAKTLYDLHIPAMNIKINYYPQIMRHISHMFALVLSVLCWQ